MESTAYVGMKPFSPEDPSCAAPAWSDYKRMFRVHLEAAGLDEKPGKRKVGQLLKCMGMEAVRIYDTFEFMEAVAAVEADPDNGIVAVPGRAGENKHDLDTVFKKFDQHWGTGSYRALKRQEFLDIKRTEGQSIMDYITHLKREAEHCDFGAVKESFICDKIINSVQDSRCSERLLELADSDCSLERVIQICRQTELTRAHIKTIENKSDKQVHRVSSGSSSRGRGRGQGRGNSRGRGQESTQDSTKGYAGSFPYCENCCRHHSSEHCGARNKQCDACGEIGHYRRSPHCRLRQHGDRPDRNNERHDTMRYHDRRDIGYNNRQDARRYDDRPDARNYDGRRDNMRADDHHSRNRSDFRDTRRRYDRAGYRDNYNNGGYSSREGYGGNQPQSRGRAVHHADELFDDYDVHNRVDDTENMFENMNVYTAKVEGHNVENEWNVAFQVYDSTLCLEIDTGARCNILSRHTLIDLGVHYVLQPSSTVVRGVHGESRKSQGIVTLPCLYKGVTKYLEFEVLDGAKKLDLLGRFDSMQFNLIARVNSVSTNDSCKTILCEYRDVVSESIGCMPGEYAIKIDSNVQPVVHAPRPVPAPLRGKVKEELDNLEQKGIIKKVSNPTDWVSSMVVVRKKNSDRVRICIDPTDLNNAVKREHFPMNNFDDVVTRLTGSKVYSTLDANMGYFQLKLDAESSELTTFNTPFGRYCYLRMPMGIKCASEVFQRQMVNQFGHIEGVEIVVDDLLIHGRTQEEHDKRLRQVLERAREINLKLNPSKCKISVSEVDYVGHKLTGEGLKPTEDRVKAILAIPDPKDVRELETMLGMIAYVSKFIPGLSDLNAPLRALKTAEEWKWGSSETKALQAIKKALTSTPVLRYYDVNKPMKLSVDASMKGLGAAIIQEKGIVAYASRALTTTEQRYAQIEKEMLAVVFGCTKFHKLIYGKDDVTVESDHKPLESLLKKPMHISPMRIQRMRLKLQPYTFKLIHTSGKNIGLADCLLVSTADRRR